MGVYDYHARLFHVLCSQRLSSMKADGHNLHWLELVVKKR